MRSEMHLGWRLPGERRLSARRRAKRLAAVMSCRLVTVGPATRVGDAADLAGEEGVHHLLVVDGASLVGVACEHDLLLAGRDARVGDCMNVPVCVDVGAGFAEAAEAMRERAIGCLPVLAGGFLVGVVTRGDLRRAGLPAEAVAAP